MTIYTRDIEQAKLQAEYDSYTLQTEIKRVELSMYKAQVDLLLSLAEQLKKDTASLS